MTFRVDNLIVKVERDDDLIALFTAYTPEEMKAVVARLVIVAYLDGSDY